MCRRIEDVEPRPRAAVVALVVAGDQVDLAVVHDRTCAAALASQRQRRPDRPHVGARVPRVDRSEVQLVRVVTEECADDVDEAVEDNRLEVVHLQWGEA